MTISSRSALVVTIAAVAAASPGTALAMPVDGGSHVSATQDLRSADARPALADQLRGHAVAQQTRAWVARNRAYRRAFMHSATTTAPAGLPIWPKHPAAIASSRPLPGSGGGGEPWIAIGAGLAGAGLIAGGFALAERRRLPRRRVAV